MSIDVLGIVLEQAQKDENEKKRIYSYFMNMAHIIASGQKLTKEGRAAYNPHEYLYPEAKRRNADNRTGNQIVSDLTKRVDAMLKSHKEVHSH